MKLVLATRNPHKLTEIRAIFDFKGLEIFTSLDFPDLEEVLEDGETLQENAIKKASETASETGSWAMADDSGLEVLALGGAPGVYSARYAGENVSYADNNRKLLRELEGEDNRRAHFRTVIALASPGGDVRTVEGCCQGIIIGEERGENGFGYDPVFAPAGYYKTFAELPAETKNKISHRSKALAAARSEWAACLD